MANKVDNRSTSSPEQCSNITPYTEDHLCELVIRSSQFPVTSRDSQPENLCLRKVDSRKQLLHGEEDGTRSKPLLPPEPRPKSLPIPQPPPELPKPSTPATQPHDSTPHTTEDPHCELVIVRNSQPPIRSPLHTQYFSELTKQLNEIGNRKLRQDGTRPQQKQPLLPPEPRPTRLPIPQPTPSHNTSDQSRDDRCLSLTISSGYGSLNRSMEGSYFMIKDDDFD